MSKAKTNYIKLTTWSANGMRLDTSGGIVGGILVAIDMLTPEQKAKLLSRISPPSTATVVNKPDELPSVGSAFEYTSTDTLKLMGNRTRWYEATCIAHYENKAVLVTKAGSIYARGCDEYTFRPVSKKTN